MRHGQCIAPVRAALDRAEVHHYASISGAAILFYGNRLRLSAGSGAGEAERAPPDPGKVRRGFADAGGCRGQKGVYSSLLGVPPARLALCRAMRP